MTRDLDLVAGGDPAGLRLFLLGRFALEGGDARASALSSGAQRLLALLALRGRPMTRVMVSGTLWPESSDAHASASLRSALTRLRADARRAVAVADIDLELAPVVRVDVREAKRLAYRLLEPDPPALDAGATARAIAAFSADVLPDWRDEWVRVERGQWRQLRLHALEALTDRLVSDGRWAEAAASARAAIRAEPLRETSHAALIRVFLAGGRREEALTHYERYRELLRDELHLDPTPQITDLLATAGDEARRPCAPGPRGRSAPPRSSAAPRRESD